MTNWFGFLILIIPLPSLAIYYYIKGHLLSRQLLKGEKPYEYNSIIKKYWRISFICIIAHSVILLVLQFGVPLIENTFQISFILPNTILNKEFDSIVTQHIVPYFIDPFVYLMGYSGADEMENAKDHEGGLELCLIIHLIFCFILIYSFIRLTIQDYF